MSNPKHPDEPSSETEDDADVRDGPMRDEIIRMVVEALNEQGLPDLDLDSVRREPAHRAAFIEMLEDCRPLPVVKQLIVDTRNGRL